MSKRKEILDLLCEEFGSTLKWNPYSFLAISDKLKEIGKNNENKMQLLGEETEKDIKDNLDTISKLKKQIEENQTLAEKKKEIEGDYDKLIEQQKQLQELLRKDNELQANQSFIDSFSEDLRQINGNIDATIAYFAKKLTDVQKLLADSELENELTEIINAVQNNLQRVKENSICQCLEEIHKLQTVFPMIDEKINTEIEEHNKKVKDLNAVSNAFNDHLERLKSVKEAYERHILSDREIYNNLTEKGEFKMESWIKTKLAELDKLLEEIENIIRTKIDERESLPTYQILERMGKTIVEK